jgi:hypothetical protein
MMDNNIDFDNMENTDLSDDTIDNLVQRYNVRDDDLMVVNNDGSYVIIPMDIAENLMANPEFAQRIDAGFSNIYDFQEFVLNYFKEQ